MVEAIQSFIETFKERGHVLKLIESMDFLKIRIIAENQRSILAFQNRNVFLLADNGDKNVSCTIRGQNESINMLVNGRENLRNLIRSGRLEVTASFRSVLLIESIFYLTKPEKQSKFFC